MENEFYTDEFEQLLKEKADQFRMYPSKRVWHSIYNNLHPSRRWPSMVMLLLLISSLSVIGYLNTGDSALNTPINSYAASQPSNQINNTTQTINTENQTTTKLKTQPQQPVSSLDNVFTDMSADKSDLYTYTVVESNRPDKKSLPNAVTEEKNIPEIKNEEENGKDLVQSMNTYIKTNKIFADVAVSHKKDKTEAVRPTDKTTAAEELNRSKDDLKIAATNKTEKLKPISSDKTDLTKLTAEDKKAIVKLNALENKKALTNEEKAWIESYALENKNEKDKWKKRLSYQVYVTPAVNYRKLTTKVKGSATAFANADINAAISQKPGFGIEAGAGITYDFAKNAQLKAGLQFNYTNYNIEASETVHPVLTSIVLNDPNTGYSYAASRTSTTSNVYNAGVINPVTLHNRTYQVSLPVGLAYKLSSEKNVEWYVGASAQPTYVFGGNAHLISADLKSYISDPSSIRTWNLNLGFETYMNFKLGDYHLQVGPQVRYQVYSTYRRDVALIEKPYAVGLKFGLTKGF